MHSENKLSKRFPIGLEEQIQKWDPDKIRRFHERWYYPANATLYLVGEFDDIPRAVREIEVIRRYILLSVVVDGFADLFIGLSSRLVS